MADQDKFDHYAQFIDNWLGHRGLTIRILEAFPEADLFGFTLAGMRTPVDLAHEITMVTNHQLNVVESGDPGTYEGVNQFKDKAAMLAAYSAGQAELERRLRALDHAQLAATHTVFGSYTGSGLKQLQYAVDNEIHHRGQLYVYLRALGIEPTPFYAR